MPLKAKALTSILSPLIPPNIDLGGGDHTGGDSGTAVNVGPAHVGGSDAVSVTGGIKEVQQWANLAVKAGKSVSPNIPPNILLGLIHVESRGNINAISSAGAFGLTQFIRSTADQYGVKPGDATSQVYGAANYLHDLGYKKGNEARAIGMYNPLNGKPNVAYSTAVLNAAKLYKVSGGDSSPGVNASNPLSAFAEGWDAVKAVVSVFINPSKLGKLVARAYAFFFKLIWKAIWEVVIAPIWHWIQRAVDYYFNQIMSGKVESGYYYNMAGIVTAFFWSVGYAILWGRAEDPGRAETARDSMLGRSVRTGQSLFASRRVVKPSKVEESTKKKPKAAESNVPVRETRRISVTRRRPVKVAGVDLSTQEENEHGDDAAPTPPTAD